MLPADISHNMGSDISVTPSGDIATVTELSRSQQRVLRRLLTNPGDYIWHQNYGAGLPRFIGQPVSVGNITAVIRAQMKMEASVLQNPAPVINVTTDGNSSFFVSIQYTESDTGQPSVLNFPIG
jgi:phage baseplate assembly protein W